MFCNPCLNLPIVNTYFYAETNCKHKCFRDKETDEIVINNQLWEKSQKVMLLERQQKGQTNADLDNYYRSEIKSKLTQANFRENSTHVRMEFVAFFGESESEAVGRPLCDSCYVAYSCHKSIRSFRQWKCEIKKNILINGRMTVVAEAEKKGKLKDIMQVGLYRNIKDARKRLKQTMPDLNEHHLKLACIPNTEASLKAFNWFEEFLTLHGDYAPNRFDKVELPGIYTKESIWGIYARHMNTLYTGPEDQKHLERTQFEEMWNNVFPNVTITKFTQVSGKCYTCHAIFDRQANFTCREELLDIKDLASIHKILIGMQRGQYIHNRQLAQEYPELYMSLILDGMSQDHCQLPYCANQDTESTGLLKQKIFGAKQHGVSKTFYRTYPYVESGANLACEVLLHEIEHRMKTCIQNCTDFPRHLMLQIDGGPENTSKTFYGLCESLVKLGVFDRIDVSRLPVGHTHEDIDALFGVLWRAAQFKTLITPDEWKKMAKDCFNVIDLDD